MRSLVILGLLAGSVHADDVVDDLMREETEFVAGPHGLEITYTWQHDTGTWHTANQLTISLGAAKLERATDDEHMILPLFAKAFDAGPNRWLLLGWSSTGSGMQTQTAWLVKKVGTALRVTDELDWTTDRGHPGLAFEGEGAKLRVGILRPPASDDEAHEAGSWSLDFGGKAHDLDRIRKLKFVAGTPALYAPPFDDTKCPCKVAWLAIAHDKFVVK